MPGKLLLVSVPIGNVGDITLRAIESLKNADAILCEDLKPARRLLHDLQITKELLPLNEHTEKEATEEALALLYEGKTLALISDAGTPLVADPGQRLVRSAIEQGIEIIPVPGASSILAALVVSGFRSDTFYFAGFLPREKSERTKAARKLSEREETIMLLEAPYRLSQLLDDLVHGFGGKRRAAVAMNLSLPTERVARGTLFELRDQFAARPFKGEFVAVLEGRPARSASRAPKDRL
ncbi:MAG TPA: 16S rRNA (cytidine(1402)-2'-O)-methyltransferase [Candidatus Kapabacteria bacterium]